MSFPADGDEAVPDVTYKDYVALLMRQLQQQMTNLGEHEWSSTAPCNCREFHRRAAVPGLLLLDGSSVMLLTSAAIWRREQEAPVNAVAQAAWGRGGRDRAFGEGNRCLGRWEHRTSLGKILCLGEIKYSTDGA